MDLKLQHADPVVELGGDRVLLVGGEIARSDKGAVMCGDIGDVRVVACAKLDVPVTRLRVCW